VNCAGEAEAHGGGGTEEKTSTVAARHYKDAGAASGRLAPAHVMPAEAATHQHARGRRKTVGDKQLRGSEAAATRGYCSD
jgi:hypothetical protein